MKKACLCLAIVTIILLPAFSIAQKTFDAEGTITAFVHPYDKITLMVDDDETEYVFNSSTSFSKGFKKEDLKNGQKIKIAYFLENSAYVIKEVKATPSKVDEAVEFTGLFEFLDNGIAYVDGKKVKLTDKSTIECPVKKMFKKDCGCEKGKPYRGFDDKNIRMGSYFNVKGKLDKYGTIQASKITVCRNLITQNERDLKISLENSFDAKGLVKVNTPKEVVSASELYEGNIKIGGLTYKLHDNIIVQSYINMVGNRITPDYSQEILFKEQNNINWRFYVIESQIPNAFAYPNGMVFVHSALLKIMDNEAQLALVLGHEIAHVLYKHPAQRFAKGEFYGGLIKNGFNGIKGLIPGISKLKDTPDAVTSTLDGFLEKLAPQNLSGLFEKTKETQADRIGLMYMYMAGYDLREAPKFWLKMKMLTGDETFRGKMNKSAADLLQWKDLRLDKTILNQLSGKSLAVVGGALLNNIYASHPLSAQRYKDINELIAAYYKDTDFSKALIGQEDFSKYLATLKQPQLVN